MLINCLCHHSQIWLNGTQLRELPEEMLTDDIWLDRLPNTVLCDLSGNRLRELPVRGFFSLMLPLRKLSLSQNRLERLHETDLKLLSKLQILVLDRNELLEVRFVHDACFIFLLQFRSCRKCIFTYFHSLCPDP
jgi:Leucine-rich repeat (LRR) protein